MLRKTLPVQTNRTLRGGFIKQMPQDANNAKWKSQQERSILLGIITKGEDSFLYVYFLQKSSFPSPGGFGVKENALVVNI
jgi:hypothetical protein